ncbi:MAG: YIP1 family protein [bacterium]
MNFLRRFFVILLEPDYATHDLHDSPHVGEAFLIVSLYAAISGVNSSVSGYFAAQSFMVGIVAFIAAALIIYLTWVFVSLLFHLLSIPLGGHGEFPHAFGYVGIAAAPLVVVSLLSFVLTLVTITGLLAEYAEIIQYVNLGSKVIGMAWGMPGVVCYFGMKNAERLDSTKASIVTLFLFFIFAGLEIYNSNLFS